MRLRTKGDWAGPRKLEKAGDLGKWPGLSECEGEKEGGREGGKQEPQQGLAALSAAT